MSGGEEDDDDGAGRKGMGWAWMGLKKIWGGGGCFVFFRWELAGMANPPVVLSCCTDVDVYPIPPRSLRHHLSYVSSTHG